MDDRSSPDTVGPWTIKTVSGRTKQLVTLAARKEGLPVGQWLDRHFSQWERDGSPVAISSPAPADPASLAELAQVLDATRAMAKAAGVKVPARLAREAFAMAREAMQERRKPKPPKPLAIQG